jgi:hypothetical protein
MEKFLSRKVEIWVVGLIAAIGVIVMIVFGNIVVHKMKGGTKAGIVGDVAMTVADIPSLLQEMNPDHYLKVVEGEHAGKSGFAYSYAPGTRPDAGYLLLSRYDGDDLRSYVEFVDLNNQKVLHRWAPDIDDLNWFPIRSTLKGTRTSAAC